MRLKQVVLTITAAFLCNSSEANAQIVIQAPYGVYNDSFYEHMGSTWSLSSWGRRGGWFFNGPGASFPPFGGYHGFGDARFGFGGRLGNTRFRINMWCSQASSRSMVMTSPMIVVPNGGYGVIQNLSWRPFVTGWTPVVGGAPQVPMMVSPVQNYVRQVNSESELYDVTPRKTNSLIERQAAIEAAKTEEPKRPPVVPRQPEPQQATENDDPPLILK